VKKVQDHYFKKAKQQGYPARSVFKLEEAQKKFRLMNKGSRVLDLGCHPGSWALYASGVVGPQGVVIGIDLQAGKPLQQANGAKIRILQGDVLSDDFFAEVGGICSEFDVLLSDMAPRTSGNSLVDEQRSLTLARRVLEIAARFLVVGGIVYCKIFEGEDFKEFVDSARQLFDRVRIFKPESSRSESREVFLVCTGYRHQVSGEGA
jgi:23S rRNA (uridine2552-2'-O)-methyltransferase